MSTRAREGIAHRISLAVGQRLLLGLAPSLLAVVLVVALRYYGEIGREAPEYVVSAAAVLALTSLLLTWWNTRYIVGRLRRLGGAVPDARGGGAQDDLDRIEGEVTSLRKALNADARAHAQERTQLTQQLHQQSTMLAATVRAVSAQVDEVRLPLHILLDARFGDLNENQEELLVAARTSSDAIDAALRSLTVVTDADRDALSARQESVALNDVVRAVLPMVRTTAERKNTRVDVMLEPALPRVWANRAGLAESLALLATLAVEQLTAGQSLVIATRNGDNHSLITCSPIDPALLNESLAIVAQRLLTAQLAVLRIDGNELTIALPRTAV